VFKLVNKDLERGEQAEQMEKRKQEEQLERKEQEQQLDMREQEDLLEMREQEEQLETREQEEQVESEQDVENKQKENESISYTDRSDTESVYCACMSSDSEIDQEELIEETLEEILEDSMFEPLYENANITISGAYCAIMEFKRACHLPFTTISKLLELHIRVQTYYLPKFPPNFLQLILLGQSLYLNSYRHYVHFLYHLCQYS